MAFVPRLATRRMMAWGFGGVSLVSTVTSAANNPLAQAAAAEAITRFVPQHITDGILEITRIMHQEFSGELTVTDISVALSVLAIMQGLSKKPVHDIRRYSAAEDSPIAKRFSHYLKYANAAYGSPDGTKHEEWIAKETGIDKRKVRPYVDEPAVRGKPMLEHFVAVDDKEKSIVVALKGTATLEGALKDVRFVYADVRLWGEKFQVHGGMWQSAMGLAEFPVLIGQLQRELAANPGYKLVVLGHSLGGGVAGLLAPLLAEPTRDGRFITNDRTVPGRSIECYGFEPAASVDEELRLRTKSMIYSLVNKNDIVPALSHGAIRDFRAVAIYLKQHTPYLAAIVDGLSKNKLDPESYLEKFRSLATNKKLVPPGRVWAIDTADDGTLEIGEVLNVNQRFGEARFISGMVMDHLLGGCKTSMEGLKNLE